MQVDLSPVACEQNFRHLLSSLVASISHEAAWERSLKSTFAVLERGFMAPEALYVLPLTRSDKKGLDFVNSLSLLKK